MPASELLKKQHEVFNSTHFIATIDKKNYLSKPLFQSYLQRGIFEDTDYPDEFEDIMHRTFAFRVKWQWSWGHGSVIMCKDDKDLVAKIQEQLPNAEVLTTYILSLI
jgi:hypothetical protein